MQARSSAPRAIITTDTVCSCEGSTLGRLHRWRQVRVQRVTPASKMTKRDGAAVLPRVKRAVDGAAEVRRSVRAKVWHDNERFLLQPSEYRRSGLRMECFPPNSGDVNPIVAARTGALGARRLRQRPRTLGQAVSPARQPGASKLRGGAPGPEVEPVGAARAWYVETPSTMCSESVRTVRQVARRAPAESLGTWTVLFPRRPCSAAVQCLPHCLTRDALGGRQWSNLPTSFLEFDVCPAEWDGTSLLELLLCTACKHLLRLC